VIRKQFSAVVKSTDPTKNTATYLLTTEALDRDDEIVLMSGLDDTEYKGNPIWLWGHEHDGPPDVCIGSAIDWKLVAEGWQFLVDYCVEENPMAKMVYGQVRKGSLRAVSIGFIPLEWVTPLSPDTEIDALPARIRDLVKSGRCRCVYTKYLIIEGSNVLIGANPQALVRNGRDSIHCRSLAEYLHKSAPDAKEEAMSVKTTPRAAPALADPGEPEVNMSPALTTEPVDSKAKALDGVTAKFYSDDFGGNMSGLHPKVLDIAGRLSMLAKSLPGSLDPNRDGKIKTDMIAHHMDIMDQCMKDLQGMVDSKDDDGGGEVDMSLKSSESSVTKVGTSISSTNKAFLKTAMIHCEDGVRKCVKGMKAVHDCMKGAGYDVVMPKDFPDEAADILDENTNGNDDDDTVLNSIADDLVKSFFR
jgi:hypothetical protein